MPITDILAVGSGGLVGFVLGLIGGGGSILAVPLLVYLVGVQSPHVAIGTSAVAVGLSALANLVAYSRKGMVKWRCALVFAAAGIVGALLGSSAGKAFDGQKLLLLFGLLMIAIAGLMLLRRGSEGDENVRLTLTSAQGLLPWLLAYGVAVGVLAGFFGIGGGFLVVPGLMASTAMPMSFAVGSSLVSVAAFGFATAGNYALSGLIDWMLVADFVLGGIVGGIAGRAAGHWLSQYKSALSTIFAITVASVGAYVVWRGIAN
ncbi:MAG: sulfite exporter TauE/SafE family protein [Hyphomicrobium sp.]|nr:sulfite exporter TauE/SafE family protein [Hyphomicrobium sp.]